MKTRFLLLSVLVATICSTNAQPIIGFWEVKQVTVGEEIVTPVAKWFRINADHTQQSGNGWLQNGMGTWAYDEENQQFLPKNKYGIEDEFGAFTVSFSGEQMFWRREEEGMKVVVTLEKIESKPMSTADLLSGLWDLTDVKKEGNTITSEYDPDDQYYLFIRWDRVYVERSASGERSAGYWHIDGHRPEVTFISHQEGKEWEKWNVEVDESKLTMTGVSDSNSEIKLVFTRIHQFPE